MAALENNNKRFFPQLTGVRAMAAYMVYLFHFNPFDHPNSPQGIRHFVNDFHTGVNVFFVLSGFLICYRYDEQFWQKSKGFYTYMVNRVARIYPVYFLITTFVFVFIYFKFHFNPVMLLKVYLANITFIRGFFDDLKFSGISQGWSLTTEECFYLLAPLIFLSLKKVKLIFQPPILIFTGFVIVTLFGSQHHYGFMQSFDFMMNFTFFGRCFEFYAGIYVALQLKKMGPLAVAKTINGLYTFGGLLIMIISMACIAAIPSGIGYTYKFGSNLFFNFFLLSIGIAVFFWGLITEKSIIYRLFSTPLFQLLGKSSYVFYLVHMGFAHEFIGKHIPGRGLPASITIFILLNILSIIIYKLIEEPANRWVKRILLPKPITGEAAAVQN